MRIVVERTDASGSGRLDIIGTSSQIRASRHDFVTEFAAWLFCVTPSIELVSLLAQSKQLRRRVRGAEPGAGRKTTIIVGIRRAEAPSNEISHAGDSQLKAFLITSLPG